MNNQSFKEESLMICKFCGNSIEDNSDFCFICGQKVENAAAFQPAQSNDVFSQAASVQPAAAPVAPVAPAQPVQAPAAAPVQAPVAAVPAEELQKKGRKAKKAKKQKDPNSASGALKFFTALFLAIFLAVPAFMWSTVSLAFIVLIIVYAVLDKKAYEKANKLGQAQKATDILNSTGIGACIGLALVCVKFFMVAYMK